MSAQPSPRVPKWPFFLGDVLLLGVATLVLYRNPASLSLWQFAGCFASVAVGAWLAVWPFLLDHQAEFKLAEAGALANTVDQIQNLELVAGTIDGATAKWQAAHENATQVVAASKEIADKLTAEAAAFSQFLQKSQDAEKQHLRLEVEKLRRAEGDWIQVAVRMLDHVHALHQAAVRSGQAHLTEQLGNFQLACRDTARRVGLVAFSPAAQEPFDANLHQPLDPKAEPPAGAVVAETIAPGFTYQSQLLRRAIVSVRAPAAAEDFSVRQLNDLKAQSSAQGDAGAASVVAVADEPAAAQPAPAPSPQGELL
jgi:molecular chaperone GrpE (heat shock protein)